MSTEKRVTFCCRPTVLGWKILLDNLSRYLVIKDGTGVLGINKMNRSNLHVSAKKQSLAYIQVIYTLIMCSLCHQGSVGRSWHPINSTMAHQGHINVSVMVGFSDSCRSSRQGQRLKSTINLLELVPLNTQPNKPATQLGHHVFTSVFSCYLFLRSEILTHPARST